MDRMRHQCGKAAMYAAADRCGVQNAFSHDFGKPFAVNQKVVIVSIRLPSRKFGEGRLLALKLCFSLIKERSWTVRTLGSRKLEA